MALFDRLIADHQSTKIIDLSHRTFNEVFVVGHKIGFFEEARRRSIEPLILFMTNPSPNRRNPTQYIDGGSPRCPCCLYEIRLLRREFRIGTRSQVKGQLPSRFKFRSFVSR
jgi:hypothetical protein